MSNIPDHMSNKYNSRDRVFQTITGIYEKESKWKYYFSNILYEVSSNLEANSHLENWRIIKLRGILNSDDVKQAKAIMLHNSECLQSWRKNLEKCFKKHNDQGNK